VSKTFHSIERKFFQKVPAVFWVMGLFVLWRLAHLMFSHPMVLFVYCGEELSRGTIAREIVQGLRFSWMDYRADDYSGGSLVLGTVASLFFRVLGPTVLALKMAPLTFFTLALGVWYRVIERFVNPKTALYFSLLYIFSPPAFTSYSLVAMGFHSETVLFTALSVFCLSQILFEERKTALWIVLFGFISGFGLWFAYVYGITLAALVIFGFWYRPRVLTLRAFILFGLGFLIGFSPWIYNNLFKGFNGLFIGESGSLWSFFSGHYFLDGFTHLRQSGIYRLAKSFASEEWPSRQRLWVDALYSVLFGGMTALSVWRVKKAVPPLIRLSVLTLFIFVVVLQSASPELDIMRYRIPALPFIFLAAAWAMSCLNAKWVVGLLISGGILSSISFFSTASIGRCLTAKGYTYQYLPAVFASSSEACRRYYERLIGRLGPEDAAELTAAVTQFVAWNNPQPHGEAILIEEAEKAPDMWKNYLCFSLAEPVLRRDAWVPKRALETGRVFDRISPRCSEQAFLGLSFGEGKEFPLRSEHLIKLRRAIPSLPDDPRAHSFLRTAGRLSARYWYSMDPSFARMAPWLDERVSHLAASQRDPFLEGVGGFLYDLWRTDMRCSARFPRQLERFPASLQAGLFRGTGIECGMNRVFDFVIFEQWQAELFIRDLNPVHRGQFEEGQQYVLNLMR
jgi:hypothetical protein